MRIEVIKQIDDETREVYTFTLFDLNAVFVCWAIETKPKGKRIWRIKSFWDKYARKDFNATEEPILPEKIRSEAISEVIKLIRINTWDEYKSRK